MTREMLQPTFHSTVFSGTERAFHFRFIVTEVAVQMISKHLLVCVFKTTETARQRNL